MNYEDMRFQKDNSDMQVVYNKLRQSDIYNIRYYQDNSAEDKNEINKISRILYRD